MRAAGASGGDGIIAAAGAATGTNTMRAQHERGDVDSERAELIRIAGVVQGVGFRYRTRELALRHGVRGWVANIGRGVVVHACGPAERLERFVRALREDIGP